MIQHWESREVNGSWALAMRVFDAIDVVWFVIIVTLFFALGLFLLILLPQLFIWNFLCCILRHNVLLGRSSLIFTLRSWITSTTPRLFLRTRAFAWQPLFKYKCLLIFLCLFLIISVGLQDLVLLIRSELHPKLEESLPPLAFVDFLEVVLPYKRRLGICLWPNH